MAVEFWRTSGKTAGTQVKTIACRLNATGGETSMPSEVEPAEVRVYNTGKSNGELINVSYAGNVVSFTDYTAEADDVIVGIVGDVFLFEGKFTVGNSTVESERTIEDSLYVFISGSNEDNCVLALEDLVVGEGVDIYNELDDEPAKKTTKTQYYLTKVADGESGNYTGIKSGVELPLGAMNDGSNQRVFTKMIVPANMPKQNSRDVLIKFRSYSSAIN